MAAMKEGRVIGDVKSVSICVWFVGLNYGTYARNAIPNLFFTLTAIIQLFVETIFSESFLFLSVLPENFDQALAGAPS